MKLPEYLSSPVSRELKVGDTAYILDTSYHLVLTPSNLHEFTSINDILKKRLKILATGCLLPTSGCSSKEPNDTIVSLESGEIIFTKLRYLQATEPK